MPNRGRVHAPRPAPARRRRGAVAIMFAMMLVPLIAMLGLAIDLPQIYQRRAELQTIADAAALAAARQLDGTAAGLANAVADAQAVAATQRVPLTLSSDAIKFSGSAGADAVWLDAGAAGTGAGLYFVKVETDAGLAPVNTIFMKAISVNAGTVSASARAVAGRSTINLMPLAICPLDTLAVKARVNPGNPSTSASISELVEYGFRRGLSYNLFSLNGNGAAPDSFLVDPMFQQGAAAGLYGFDPALVAPFVCSGTMAASHARGAWLRVRTPFPLGSLLDQLNSRFNLYATPGCNLYSAPPDTNIKQYSAPGWMSATPAGPVASGQVINMPPGPVSSYGSVKAIDYGPLWSYAKPAVYAATEPLSGYQLIAPPGTGHADNWRTLYPSVDGGPGLSGAYPVAGSPYSQTSGVKFFAAPLDGHTGLKQRRVLYIPLLECPVTGGMAKVLAVGRFFMTSQASATILPAEFGGVVKTETELAGRLELVQ